MHDISDILLLGPQERLLLYNVLLGDPDEQARIGAWEWDMETNLCVWSETTCRMFGFPPQTRMQSAQIFMNVIHPEDRDYVIHMSEAAMMTEKAPPMEYRILLEDGTIRHIRARGRALRDKDGKVLKMVGTVVDITTEKQDNAHAEDDVASATLKRLFKNLRLVEPTRGGGGFLVLRKVQIQLSQLQFALIKMLTERQRAETDLSEKTRGYIPSAELLHELPWETPHPTAANLKQNIRRTRALLKGSGLKIEATRGLGYRIWEQS